MLKRSYLFLFVASLFLTCCKKDNEAPSVPEFGTFMPVKTGNFWSYTGDNDYTVTVNGNTKTIDGKVYVEFQSSVSGQTTNSYYRYENGDYIGLTEEFDNFSLVFLKENASKGDQWETEILQSNVSTQVKYSLEVIDFLDSKEVQGTTYEDIQVVEMTVYMNFSGTGVFDPDDFFAFSSQTAYYAKNVGLIKQEGILFGVNSELIDYNLN